jgi:hypothetical protein
MPRGGIIAGAVRRPGGEAVADARIDLYRRTSAGVERVVGTPVFADDRGQYRLSGLEPAAYLVAAVPHAPASARAIQYTSLEVDAALARLASGQFSGPGIKSGGAAAATPAALTFYPNALDASEAQVVELDLGAERYGNDIVLRNASSGTITGIAVGSSGPLAGAMVTLEPMAGPTQPVNPTTLTGRDGTFTFATVSAGNYWLRGTTRPAQGNGSSEQRQIALVRVSVDSGATQPVTMVFSGGHTVAGRVRAVGFSTENDSAGGSWSVVARPLSLPAGLAGVSRSARLGSGGLFRLEGLLPGRYVLDLVGLPAGATIEAVSVSGRLSTDRTVDLTRETSVDVALTATPGATVSGRLIGPDGEGVSGYTVIMFPASQELRHPWLQLTRLSRTASDGFFAFDALPPAEYLLHAFVDLGPIPQDLEFLRAAEPLGVKVTVQRSAKVVQNLMFSRKRPRANLNARIEGRRTEWQ